MAKKNKPYVVNKGIPTKSLRLLVVIVTAYAGKLTEFATFIVGIPFTGVEIMLMIDQLVILLGKSRGRDMSATDEAQALALIIRANYSTNAYFIENIINTTNNPALAAKLLVVLRKAKGPVSKARISVKNTSVSGRVAVTLHKVAGSHSYIIEYTQIAEDGTPIVTLQKTLGFTTGNIEGLIPGAKYMFRAQPITSRDNDAEWTEYVMLRVS